MPEALSAAEFLARSRVDADVFALRPDYRALLLVAEGLDPATADPAQRARVDGLVAAAEEHARTVLEATPVDQAPHIASWRDAYRAFGSKPQRTRNSVEALTRRAPGGLPRVNTLTDAYNAISVLHQIPLGGEDMTRYDGPARLARATGEEDFDTAADGAPVIEHPEPGEVIWRDDRGVTCRRWNWRQCRRTALTDQTHTALFILDALAPLTDADVLAAGDALASALSGLSHDVQITRRLLAG